MGDDCDVSADTARVLRDDAGFLIIGGGIAGSTCAIEIKRLCPDAKVTLVCPAAVVKSVRGVEQTSPSVGVVDVEERSIADFAVAHPEISLVRDAVTRVDHLRSQAILSSGNCIPFARCCVATGASPVLAAVHSRVICIRDTESVEQLNERLVGARRVLIVGNGGIALELVHALTSMNVCQVIWAIRDDYIGNTFFDASASAFVLPTLASFRTTPEVESDRQQSAARPPNVSGMVHNKTSSVSCSAGNDYHNGGSKDILDSASSERGSGPSTNVRMALNADVKAPYDPYDKQTQMKEVQYTAESRTGKASAGGGLGPDWVHVLTLGDCDGHNTEEGAGTTIKQPSLDVHFGCQLDGLIDHGGMRDEIGQSWPVWARLTNEVTFGCDFIVSATGVKPNTGVLGDEFKRGREHGLMVDELMRVLLEPDSAVTPDGSRGSLNAFTTKRTASGGNEFERQQQSCQREIFAAGDCCRLEWPAQQSQHWFQMRLWSQARAMGLYTAKCMTDSVDELGSGGHFDLFVHATRFFGHKVILLGHFNGQGLGVSVQDFLSRRLIVDADTRVRVHDSGLQAPTKHRAPCWLEDDAPDRAKVADEIDTISRRSAVEDGVQVLVRTSPGVEYVKVILEKGRVRGAMLIGETGLEETFENLILNATDVSHFGVDLLCEHVDIEDYFD